MRWILLTFVLLLTTPLIPRGYKTKAVVDNVDTYEIYTLYNGNLIGDQCEMVDFISMCDSFGYNPNCLSRVIEHESGYRTTAINPYSGASGLIQFLPTTARDLGTSVQRVRRMSFHEQLILSLKYLKAVEDMHNVVIRDSIDMYLAVFKPASLVTRQEKTNFILYRRGTKIYHTNRPNDFDNDGDIDMYDIGRLMRYDPLKVDTLKIRKSFKRIYPVIVREYDLSVRH